MWQKCNKYIYIWILLHFKLKPSSSVGFRQPHQGIRLRVASLPFRTHSSQKDNLSCVIMSICDLGQALVMHERFYGQTQDRRAHAGWPLQMKHNRVYCGERSALLLLTASKLLFADACACVQELSPSACGHHSSLPAAAAAARSRDNILAGSGTCSRRRHEMRPCPCAQTAKHNNYQPAGPSPTGWRGEESVESEGNNDAQWRWKSVFLLPRY